MCLNRHFVFGMSSEVMPAPGSAKLIRLEARFRAAISTGSTNTSLRSRRRLYCSTPMITLENFKRPTRTVGRFSRAIASYREASEA